MSDKRFLLMTVAICTAGLILCGFTFYRWPSFILLVIGFAGLAVSIVAVARYIDIVGYERERRKGKKCRMCGQRKNAMALEYGDDEGLCRDCLNELMPMLQKAQEGKTETCGY